MRRVLVSLTLVVFFTSISFAQSEVKTSKQIKEIEPFSISRGKMFSASSPQIKTNNSLKTNKTNIRDISNDLQEALNVINQNYIDSTQIDYNEIFKSSISSMLHTLDPHSSYFDTSEFDELMNEQNSEYFGIGATIANFESNGVIDTYVTSTFQDSPAFRAGLRFGDKIIEVNGKKVTGQSSLYVRDKVRGEKGTTVRLKIERATNTKPLIVALKRNRVPQPSIPDAYILGQGVGYIDFTTGFNYTTKDELDVAIAELQKLGMRSLILDMRDNPGGILEQAVRVAEKFLPKGKTIVSQKGRFVIDSRKWTSQNRTPLDIPLVILVNDETASASEIVAGALQDYDRALIVGQKTFGKGLVQSIINLPYGAGLTLTTAKYYTPTGRSIQRDYSNGNLYDYYQQKISLNSQEKQNSAKRTVSGRTVYGGDGITPDELIKSPKMTNDEIKLLDSIFLFSRDLTSGKIKGFESYKILQQKNYGLRIKENDYPITQALLDKYFEYVGKNNNSFNDLILRKNQKFITERIRYNVISAAFGSIAANQVLIENDLEVMKAVNVLPKAQQLAKVSAKISNKK